MTSHQKTDQHYITINRFLQLWSVQKLLRWGRWSQSNVAWVPGTPMQLRLENKMQSQANKESAGSWCHPFFDQDFNLCNTFVSLDQWFNSFLMCETVRGGKAKKRTNIAMIPSCLLRDLSSTTNNRLSDWRHSMQFLVCLSLYWVEGDSPQEADLSILYRHLWKISSMAFFPKSCPDVDWIEWNFMQCFDFCPRVFKRDCQEICLSQLNQCKYLENSWKLKLMIVLVVRFSRAGNQYGSYEICCEECVFSFTQWSMIQLW